MIKYIQITEEEVKKEVKSGAIKLENDYYFEDDMTKRMTGKKNMVVFNRITSVESLKMFFDYTYVYKKVVD